MKTLIINGSPRDNGDTVTLINEFLNHLNGEYKVISSYKSNISPCIDCRKCWTNSGCYDNNEWRNFEEYLLECDNVVIASPIYFSELTGPLLSLVSKVQSFWAARYFRKEEIVSKSKKGGIILVGGGDGNIEKAEGTAKNILRHMKCNEIAPSVICHNTNEIPAIEDTVVVERAMRLAEYFNISNLD
ncbi:flavodoxin family protein [Fusibacter bizertensis]